MKTLSWLSFLFLLGMVLSPISALSDEVREPAASPSPSPETKAAPASAEKTFTGEAAKIKQMFDELFEASKTVNAPPDKKAASRAKIESSLDWDRIAAACLGPTWKKTSEANRNQFKGILKDVILKTAWNRLDTFWTSGTLSSFDKIDVTGSDGIVSARFSNGDRSFNLEYFVNKKGPKWQIYDVSFESERYSTNIHMKVNQFLKEKSFPGLIAKLKERRDELDQEAASPKTNKKS